MGILSKIYGNQEQPKSFTDRLSSIKSVFKQSHAEAVALNDEMNNEIVTKEGTIAIIQKEVQEIQETQKGVTNFIKNIEGLI